MMVVRKTYKTFMIIALSILVAGLLPGVAMVWAEAGPNLAGVSSNSEPLIPPAQGEGPGARPPSAFDDMIVQFGEEAEDISIQSDGSGVEIVPAAAFVHTGQLDNDTQAEDWFFPFDLGVVTSDSATNDVCLAAPVYLPPGSIIESFTTYVFDGFPPNDLIVYLDRTSVLGGWDELASVRSVNSSSIQVLTDPSILPDDDANIVAPFYNYHVDFCLPAGSGDFIVVLGAQINYSIPPQNVYLPAILKNPAPTPPPIPPTTLFITNNTGGNLTYTVFGTPEGNITCNIPAGAQDQVCGAFTSGSYSWQVVTICNPPTASGINKSFPSPEKHLTPFYCR